MQLYYLRSMTKLYVNNHIKITNNTVFINGNKDYTSEFDDHNQFFKSVYKYYQIKYGKFYKMDGLSKLGFLASELLLRDADTAFAPEETAIILANESSSLNTDIKYQSTVMDIPSPSVFVYTLPNIVIGEICIRHLFRGEILFLVQEAFDIDFICSYINNIFTTTKTRRCITGWLELNDKGKYSAQLFLVTGKESDAEFNVKNVKYMYYG